MENNNIVNFCTTSSAASLVDICNTRVAKVLVDGYTQTTKVTAQHGTRITGIKKSAMWRLHSNCPTWLCLMILLGITQDNFTEIPRSIRQSKLLFSLPTNFLFCRRVLIIIWWYGGLKGCFCVVEGTCQLKIDCLRNELHANEMVAKYTRKLPYVRDLIRLRRGHRGNGINLSKVSTLLKYILSVSFFLHSFVDSPAKIDLWRGRYFWMR